jgi:ATP-dependent exoDNAse (exonuclease V) beta subunit
LRIKESNPISDDLEQNELGSCIHAVLEKIYTPLIGNKLTAEPLAHALENVDSLLAEALDQQFHHGRIHEGRNHFLESVAKIQITNFLKSEIRNIEKGDEIKVVALEKELAHSIQIDVGGAAKEVVVAGKADRIDRWNDYTRIIDYKTGKVDPTELKVNEHEPKWEKVSDKWFQVMIYTWLWQQTKQFGNQHLSGIYPLGHLKSDLLVAQWEGSTILSPEHLVAFKSILHELVSEIMNPNIPFTANPNNKSCAYCPFAETCQHSVELTADN